MDTPKPLAESTPETVMIDEQLSPKGIEATPVAEQIANTPTLSPVIPAKAGIQTIDPGSFVSTQDDDKVTSEDVADLTSSTILSADDSWVHKVKQVIKDDSGQPYKEEEDAEKLNEEYMKNRFNIDVDAPIEEKN